jgi:hypothetical protein
MIKKIKNKNNNKKNTLFSNKLKKLKK